MGAAVVLVALLAIDWKKPPASNDPEALPKVAELARVSADDVKKVEVIRPDKPFTLEKRDGRWTFTAPATFRANPKSVESWLKTLLDDNSPSQILKDKPGADVSGFDKPAVQVAFTKNNGEVRTLQYGKDFKLPGETSTGNLYYARELKDDRQFMLSSGQVTDLRNKKLDELRDKRLTELQADRDVQSVVFQRPEGATEVKRVDEDKWELVQPFPAGADSFDVGDILSRLRTSEADSFAADNASDLAKYGLDKPRLTLIAKTGKGEIGVSFGKADDSGKVYTIRRGETEVTLVTKETFDALNKTASDLREKKLITFEDDKISYVELRNSHGAMRFQKSGAKEWTNVSEGAGGGGKADTAAVERIISTIKGTAAKHIEEHPKSLTPYGLDDPLITVTVNTGTSTSQVFMLGKKHGENYYAKGAPDAVFEVQAYWWGDLNVRSESFKPKDETKK